MADLTSERPFPRGVLLGAAVLLGFSVLSAGAARITGIGTTTSLASTPVKARTLRFEDRPDGRVVVLEETASGQRPVEVLAPGTNGFIRSVLRGLARERMLRGIGSEPAFRLTRWTDGRLSLEDSATGRRIELDAFGPTNVAAFGRLLYVSRQGSQEQGAPQGSLRGAARWEETR